MPIENKPDGYMSLHFNPRTISYGFMALLKNVYYYTARWGFSVREFTGQHQNYWGKLPKRLRDVSGAPGSLNSIIAELEVLSQGSERRQTRRRALVKEGGFMKKEVVINEQLLAILASLPHELLAATFRRLTSTTVLPDKAQLVERDLDTSEQLIEPDFLILGGRQLLMGELKVKADPNTGDTMYGANQLFNYLSLAVKCLAQKTDDLPDRFAHVILLPRVEFRWLIKGEQWITQLKTGKDGHMEFDIQNTYLIAQKQKKQKYLDSAEKLEKLLQKIPVYCRSYSELADAMKLEIEGYPLADHWQRIHNELATLATHASSGV